MATSAIAAARRLALVGVHDATILNSFNHTVSLEDNQNGTYSISMVQARAHAIGEPECES